MPQLDKYTVIVKRRWIDKKSENKWFCSLGSGDYTSVSQSLFWFEGGLLNNVFYTYNRGYKNPIVLPELISIQSSDDYNGLHINESNAVQAGNKLFIGSVGENDNTHVTADFYQLLLFDRVLTDFLAIPYLNVGVTSQRPGNADNGFQFFDVTLRKPIWWNGSSWVDASGASV